MQWLTIEWPHDQNLADYTVNIFVTWLICCWFCLLHRGIRCVSALWSWAHPAWEEALKRSFGKGRMHSWSLTTTFICPTWSLPKSEKSCQADIWQAVSSLHDLELLIGKMGYKDAHEYLVLYWTEALARWVTLLLISGVLHDSEKICSDCC